MKKLLRSTTIAMSLVLVLTSIVYAFPAEVPEYSPAVRTSVSAPCRSLADDNLAEIPSHFSDYLRWDRIINCTQVANGQAVIPLTGSTRPGSYEAFKMFQADLLSGL